MAHLPNTVSLRERRDEAATKSPRRRGRYLTRANWFAAEAADHSLRHRGVKCNRFFCLGGMKDRPWEERMKRQGRENGLQRFFGRPATFASGYKPPHEVARSAPDRGVERQGLVLVAEEVCHGGEPESVAEVAGERVGDSD